GAVAVAVDVLFDGVDLKPGPSVEPDVRAEGGRGQGPSAHRGDRRAFELRVLSAQDALDAPLRLAPGDPVPELAVAAVKLYILAAVRRVVGKVHVQPLGVEGGAVFLPVGVHIVAAPLPAHRDRDELRPGIARDLEGLIELL